MNSNQINNRLYPTSVITVYGNKNKTNYYLEELKVKTVNGKLLFMPAVPLADDALKSLANSYTKANSTNMEIGGIVSPHLLYCSNRPGTTSVMWYRPEMQRLLNLSASLEIKETVTVFLPATLFLVLNNDLYVFALMTSDRPDNTTKLYNAPFFNIYTDGKVCLGSANVGKNKKETFEKEAERFEVGFFMAEQTHGNIDSCKTPLRTLWPKLMKSKEAFPSVEELKAHSKYKTVGDLINKVILKNAPHGK